MKNTIDIYLGCYTTKLSEELDGKGEGIVHVRFDEDTQELQQSLVATQRNPTYLTKHPSLPVLYAAEELEIGDGPRVYAYRIADDGDLCPLNSQPISGAFACHLSVVGDHLLVANYGSGNVDSYPLETNGTLGMPGMPIQHMGHGPNKDRQEGPHAHMIYPFDEELLYVADLGIDRCKAYDLQTGQLNPAAEKDLVLPAGSGPRHLVRHPALPIVYVLTELHGTICSYHVAGAPEPLEEVSFFPAQASGIPSGAAIRMDPERKFLFASERTSNTITQFGISDDGRLEKHHVYQLEDDTPRDFNLFGPWMVVAGQDSNSLSWWKRTEGDKYVLVTLFDNVMTGSCVLSVS